jgi:hypothetical protein
MRGQMFGNLLNTIGKQGGRAVSAAAPILRAAAVPAGIGAGIGLGVLGVGALGKAGVDAVQGNRTAAGRTPLTGEEAGMSQGDTLEVLKQVTGLTTQQIKDLAPVLNQMQNENLRRGMEATRQVGQIQGSLARQKYGYQLAGGAQQLAGNALNTLVSNPNPYAQTGLSGVSLSL